MPSLVKIDAMRIRSKITRADLRHVLNKALTTADLDNFCCVYYPEIFGQFSSGMNSIERQTLLMERSEPKEVFQKLYEYAPERVEDALDLLEFRSSDHFAAISAKLQRLTSERDDYNHRILDLKLQLRRGEQLLPRESLASDRYVLAGILAVGPTTTTWRALDQSRKQDVAVRILQTRFSIERNRIDQFFKNHWCQAELRHTNVARVIQEPAEEDGIYYTVIEYAKQGDLERGIINEWISVPEALNVLQQVSLALDFIHAQEVFHFDIKPTNVLIDPSGRAMISDINFHRVKSQTISTYDPDITPRFSAPELRRGTEGINSKADIYSLCMVLLFVLDGRNFHENMEDDRTKFPAYPVDAPPPSVGGFLKWPQSRSYSFW